MEKRYKDVILAAITSHIPENIMEMELILEPIETTGLVKKSLLRLDFLMTIPEELISRKIGRLPENSMIEVEHKLRKLSLFTGARSGCWNSLREGLAITCNLVRKELKYAKTVF